MSVSETEILLSFIPKDKFKCLTYGEMKNKHKKLVDLKEGKNGKHQAFINSAIHVLKSQNDLEQNVSMTDHAFVRSLERIYGLNIGLLKEAVYQHAKQNRKFRFRYAPDGAIVTLVHNKRKNEIHA